MRTSLIISVFLLCQSALLFESVGVSETLHLLPALVATNAMAVALILASWPKLEARIAGTYRLHRAFALLALGAVLIHWGISAEQGAGVWPVFTQGAAELGEWVIWALLTLIAVSVIKLLPYRWWKKTHHAMWAIYFGVLLHSLFAPSALTLNSPAWWSMALLGAVVVFALLRKWLMRPVPLKARLSSIVHHDDMLELRATKPAGLSWKPGQYAVLQGDNKGLNEAHPFTIASCDNSGELCFWIRRSGPFTAGLQRALSAGDTLLIQHIGGVFTPAFNTRRKAQVWLAGGAGITPFLAALQAMQPDDGAAVKLIYAAGRNTQEIVQRLQDYAAQLPQLELCVLAPGERLQRSHITTGDAAAALYMCGPQRLCAAGREYWLALGYSVQCIHCESFDFRGAQIDLVELLVRLARRFGLRVRWFKMPATRLQRSAQHLILSLMHVLKGEMRR
ncbi:MAG: hypothetical protein ACPG4U_04810 [Pseudomonadales bacterium]